MENNLRKCTLGAEYHRARCWVLLCLRFLRMIYLHLLNLEILLCTLMTLRFSVQAPRKASLAIYWIELFPWCINNRLTPHPGKCEVMLLSKARLIGPLPTIYSGKSIIEYKATARLLGVALDENLSWIPHLKEVIKNFANKLSLLKKSNFYPVKCVSHFTWRSSSHPLRMRYPFGAGLIRQSYLKHWKDDIAMLLELFLVFHRTCQQLTF